MQKLLQVGMMMRLDLAVLLLQPDQTGSREEEEDDTSQPTKIKHDLSTPVILVAETPLQISQ